MRKTILAAVMAAIMGAVLAAPGAAEAAPTCTAVCYVSATGNDANSGSTPSQALLKVETAVSRVAANGQVRVLPGTYPTSAQVVITKNLSIRGQGFWKPVITPPATLPQVTLAAGAWFLVNPGVKFNLGNVVLNGTGASVFQAVRSHGLTSIDDVDFRSIQGPTYFGVAVESFGGKVPGGAGSDTHGGGGMPATLTVTDSTFVQIGRIGVLVKGDQSTATISRNSYQGKGAIDGLDYAFEAGAGGAVVISDNKISGNLATASDGSGSAGVLVTDYYGPGTKARISGNRITGNTDGIAVGYLANDKSSVVARRNDLSRNELGIDSTADSVLTDGSCNWWGSSTGPGATEGTGTGSGVTKFVSFTPWLKSRNLDGRCGHSEDDGDHGHGHDDDEDGGDDWHPHGRPHHPGHED